MRKCSFYRSRGRLRINCGTRSGTNSFETHRIYNINLNDSVPHTCGAVLTVGHGTLKLRQLIRRAGWCGDRLQASGVPVSIYWRRGHSRRWYRWAKPRSILRCRQGLATSSESLALSLFQQLQRTIGPKLNLQNKLLCGRKLHLPSAFQQDLAPFFLHTSDPFLWQSVIITPRHLIDSIRSSSQKVF